jgi:hypothetical protein
MERSVYSSTLTTSAVPNLTETGAALNNVVSIVSENSDVPNNIEQGKNIESLILSLKVYQLIIKQHTKTKVGQIFYEKNLLI